MKKALSALMVLVFIVTLFPQNIVLAQTVASGDCSVNKNGAVTWSLDSEGTLTISGTGTVFVYERQFSFPKEVDTPWQEYYEDIKNIVINEGISIIGDYAFSNCINAQSVTIPESVAIIGEFAFLNCNSLTSVTLSKNIRLLRTPNPFAGCDSLKEFCVDDENPYYKAVNGILYNKTGEELVAFPNQASYSDSVFDGVVTIGSASFRDNSTIESIVLPQNIDIIDDFAFYGTSKLKRIVLNEGLSKIGVHWGYSFLHCTALELITMPSTYYYFPDLVGCTALKELYIPDTVKNVPLLQRCTNLKKVKLSAQTEKIPELAFLGCTALEEVIIHNGLASVERSAFSGCNNLKTINFLGTAQEWSNIQIESGNDNLLNANLNYVVQAESIAINRESIDMNPGESYSIEAIVLPENAISKRVVWTSSNNDIATVTDGIVSAISPGTVVITASTEDGKHNAVCTVNVEDVNKEPVISLMCNNLVNSEETFDVYVTVTENSNICGGRITLGYDNSALDIISASKVDLLSGVSIQENLAYTDSSARISWAGYTNVTSGGNLLKITFKAKTLFEDVNASIYVQEMKFTDFDENVISCISENASVLIKAKALPTFSIECPEVALIGSTVDVKVNITENSKAFGGKFDLVYDNTKLQLISNQPGVIFSDATPITNPNYTNKIRMTWAGTSEMLEGGTLLTVTFKALEVPGKATFSLENYRMRGDEDGAIDVLVNGNSMDVVTKLVCSTKTTYIEENGQWKFTSAIKNCPETAIIMVALYSDDRMVGLSEMTDISNETSKDLYVNKCVFDKVKVFIWETFETLRPLTTIEEISYE